jgi:hypothetical protein
LQHGDDEAGGEQQRQQGEDEHNGIVHAPFPNTIPPGRPLFG